MLQSIKQRLNRDDEGFTLIELMVVVLIIAILIAIAIPTFLGARERAQDKQVQSNLRNALTAEKVLWTDAQSYQVADAAGIVILKATEASLDWAAAPVLAASLPKTVHVATAAVAGAANQVVCLTGKSVSGKYFSIIDIAQGANAGTGYYKATAIASLPACADAAHPAANVSW